MTVCGPIAPEALGFTSMHEHILCDDSVFRDRVEHLIPADSPVGIEDPISLENLVHLRHLFMLTKDNLRMTDVDWLFYIGYPVATVLLIITAALGADSLIVVLFSVGAYAILQLLIVLFMPKVRNTVGPWLYFWLPALVSIGLATLAMLPLCRSRGPYTLK
mgnify:CR=1 FL=1